MPVDPSTLDIPKIIDTALVLIGLFGGIFGAHGLAVKNKGKTVIAALSDAFTNVASAARDENVTEGEFQAIVNDATTIHNALLPDKKIPAPTTPVVTGTNTVNTTAPTPPSPEKTS